MSERDVLVIFCWLFILAVPVNAYIVWHGWMLNRSVSPRSAMLRALLYTKASLWSLNLYLAVIGYRYINEIEPVLPFGGIGLSAVLLFLLLAPLVIHAQMRQFVGEEQARDEARHEKRDEGRDAGRDEVRDPARDAARDAEHDEGLDATRTQARDETRDEARDIGRDSGRDEARDVVRDEARDIAKDAEDDGGR